MVFVLCVGWGGVGLPGWWLRWRWVGVEWEGGHIGFATLVFQFFDGYVIAAVGTVSEKTCYQRLVELQASIIPIELISNAHSDWIRKRCVDTQSINVSLTKRRSY